MPYGLPPCLLSSPFFLVEQYWGALVAARPLSCQYHTDETEQEKQPMSTSGLSKAHLARMHDVMAGYVERGEVPGLVTLVSRRGEVHVDAIGTLALADATPMQRDTI